MDFTCKRCSKILELIDSPLTSWNALRHENLLQFADYDNGVSEGSTLYICKKCLFHFEIYSHIGLGEDELIIQLITNLSEKDILAMASTLVMSDEALLLQTRLLKGKFVQVYLFADLWKPTIFYMGTEKETIFYSLEILHRFGFNNAEFNKYTSLKLSMIDLISGAGKNDLYYEKSFIFSFVVRAEDLTFKASATSIIITTSKTILPEQINMYDLETKQWTPLPDLQVESCFQRDHYKYLKILRDQQRKHNIQLESDYQRKSLIQNKVNQIKDSPFFRASSS
ncbi:hypothetical protein [Candidatus Pristimantibacillus sp. PTI5]|uniref:hypothetical protein n=1 Tax=Candidatus Pristimantibacillus sp. PTI5 TaxID=3400422 RepID=UPI003B0208B0